MENDERQGQKNETDRQNLNNKKEQHPNIAPSMEMDELEVEASKKEVKEGKSTSVTKLVVDRYD